MFRILSTTAFLQPSVLSLKTISHQGKFFFRRRHQVEPLMKMRDIRPIPPPGDNLELPSDWTAEKYLQRIGGGCSEFADKFETLQELFECDKTALKEKGVKTQQRRYILRVRELMKRGIVTFEYLNRRTTWKFPEEKKKK